MPADRRMTWEEMVAEYPDQWIGVVDAEVEGSNIRSGIVKYVGKSKGELALMQIRSNDLIGVYTTPDNLAPLGVVGYLG